MPHQAYMLGLILVVFAIGFILLARPNLVTAAFVVLVLCVPLAAVILDVKLIPYSFWVTDGANNPGGIILGWMLYSGAALTGTFVGVVYRKHRFPEMYAQ